MSKMVDTVWDVMSEIASVKPNSFLYSSVIRSNHLYNARGISCGSLSIPTPILQRLAIAGVSIAISIISYVKGKEKGHKEGEKEGREQGHKDGVREGSNATKEKFIQSENERLKTIFVMGCYFISLDSDTDSEDYSTKCEILGAFMNGPINVLTKSELEQLFADRYNFYTIRSKFLDHASINTLRTLDNYFQESLKLCVNSKVGVAFYKETWSPYYFYAKEYYSPSCK